MSHIEKLEALVEAGKVLPDVSQFTPAVGKDEFDQADIDFHTDALIARDSIAWALEVAKAAVAWRTIGGVSKLMDLDEVLAKETK